MQNNKHPKNKVISKLLKICDMNKDGKLISLEKHHQPVKIRIISAQKMNKNELPNSIIF